jgi:hypothetical protein
MMAAKMDSEILLLSLAYQDFLEEIYAPLLDKLTASVTLKRAKTVNEARRYLEGSNPRAIIVTDEGLADRRNRNVLQKVVSYAHNGGLVIIGLHFPTFIEGDRFDNLFNTAFGLPWKRGSYHRTVFKYNPSSVLPPGTVSSSLPEPCSMKAVHVKHTRPHERIFLPISNATTQSFVFDPEPVDGTEPAVAGASVGDGYLVYCGDVNGEEGSNKIILSLCGIAS